MNKKIDVEWRPIILVSFITILGLSIAGIIISNEMHRETKFIEGEVIDYKIISENNYLGGKTNYLILTFDNNESYKFSIREEFYDFTVNSRLILKITKGGQEIAWSIEQIIKVPEKPYILGVR